MSILTWLGLALLTGAALSAISPQGAPIHTTSGQLMGTVGVLMLSITLAEASRMVRGLVAPQELPTDAPRRSDIGKTRPPRRRTTVPD